MTKTGGFADVAERNKAIVEAVRLGTPCYRIAERLGLAKSHVQKIVRRETGRTVYQWRAGP